MDVKLNADPKRKLFDKILNFFAYLSAAMLLILVLMITLNAVTRYFFGKSIVWSYEISEYILLLITFLSAAWVLGEKGHVRVDIILQSLSPSKKRLLNVLVCSLGVIVCAIFLWHSLYATYNLYTRGVIMAKTLFIPKYLLIAVIPLGNLLLMVQFGRMAVSYLSGNINDDNE